LIKKFLLPVLTNIIFVLCASLPKIQLKTVNFYSTCIFYLKCQWMTNNASKQTYKQHLVQVTNASY